jgi:uncharacterized repeat protein (TIGR01451 family)
VPFFVRSNEVIVEVVDPTAPQVTREELPPVDRAPATAETIVNEAPAKPQAAAPATQEAATAPAPSTSSVVAGGAIGKSSYEPQRGGTASDSRAGAATRSVGPTGQSLVQSQHAEVSSGAGIGGSDVGTARGSTTGGAVTGATTRQYEHAGQTSGLAIGGTTSGAERGGGTTASARGEAMIQHATGDVTGSRAIGDVKVTAQRPQLAIEKHVDRTRVMNGYTLTFRLTVRNIGPLPVRAAEVRDALPDTLVVTSTSGASRIQDKSDPQSVQFRVREPFPPNAEQIITITTQVRSSGATQ